jgi:DNA-directed RNA polymerase subunit RPC12/RpoP
LVAVELLGLAFTLTMVSALGVWLYLRQNRRLETMPAHAPVQDTKEGKSAAIVPVIAFACASCGKSLKAKAELAGKKVKCTQCGKAVLVQAAAR